MRYVPVLFALLGSLAPALHAQPDKEERPLATLTAVLAVAASEKVAVKVEVTAGTQVTVDELSGAWVAYQRKAFERLAQEFKSVSHLEAHAIDTYCVAAQVGPMTRFLHLPTDAGHVYVARISPAVPSKITTVTVQYKRADGKSGTSTLSCARLKAD